MAHDHDPTTRARRAVLPGVACLGVVALGAVAASGGPLVLAAALTAVTLAAVVAVVRAAGRHAPQPGAADAAGDQALAELEAGLRAIAEGDLGVEVHVAEAGVPPRVRACVAAYGESREAIQRLVGPLSETVAQLFATAREVAHASETASRSVDEIAQAATEVAEGAERQGRAVVDVQTLTEAETEASAGSAALCVQTREAGRAARESALEGAGAVAEAAAAMEAVQASSEQVASTMHRLEDSSEHIGGIVASISGLADQTNMLALNAAIEAARAGDQGRGFGVVAEEVRRLAEESRKAADAITAMIGDLRGEIAGAAGVVEAGERPTAQAQETVEHAREVFERIASGIAEMNERLEQIDESSHHVADDASRTLKHVGDVAEVAEQSASSSEELAAAAEETNAATHQIASSAVDLSRTAERLEELVRRFGFAAELGMQITAATAAHAAWKSRLADAVEAGESATDPATLRRDDVCPFGCWLHETIDEGQRDSADYHTVHDLHEQFHQHAAEVLTLAVGGRDAEAKAAMGPQSAFATTSARLQAAMADWKRRCSGGSA